MNREQPYLTPRQMEVVALIARGKQDKEIGEQLHIGYCTVRVYVTRIMDRLGVHSRIEIAIWYYRSQVAHACHAPRQKKIPAELIEELLAI